MKMIQTSMGYCEMCESLKNKRQMNRGKCKTSDVIGLGLVGSMGMSNPGKTIAYYHNLEQTLKQEFPDYQAHRDKRI